MLMLEVGQPLHAYDLDKLQGGTVVRCALPEETLKTLDGQVRNVKLGGSCLLPTLRELSALLA
jgi:phenylalanyl-tRNA synthetase beta chain